jgi:hypothetical protein
VSGYNNSCPLVHNFTIYSILYDHGSMNTNYGIRNELMIQMIITINDHDF